MVDEIDRLGNATSTKGADRRVFRVTLEAVDGKPDWERVLDEMVTPHRLVGLWKRGASALED